MDLAFIEKFLEGRHLILPPLGNRLNDSCLRRSIQPDSVSQVGSAQSLITLALRAMTGHAVGLEDICTAR